MKIICNNIDSDTLHIIKAIKYIKCYFPELNGVHIYISKSKIKTTMLCKPVLNKSMVYRSKRSYTISFTEKNSFGVPFNEIPQNALIGIIAHELCHIVDYQKRDFIQLLKLGLGYLAVKQRKRFIERKIDFMVIDRGLGRYLLEWTNYCLSNTESKTYRKEKMYYYLSPDEIRRCTMCMKSYS
jgi:hypothetical protein